METFHIKTKAEFIGVDEFGNEVLLGDPSVLSISTKFNRFFITFLSEIDDSDVDIYRFLNFTRGKVEKIRFCNSIISDKELEFASECHPSSLYFVNSDIDLSSRMKVDFEDIIYIEVSNSRHIDRLLSPTVFPNLEIAAFGEGVDLTNFDASLFMSLYSINFLGASIPNDFIANVKGVSLSEKNIKGVDICTQFPFIEVVNLYSGISDERSPLLVSDLNNLLAGCHGIDSIVFSRFVFSSNAEELLDLRTKFDYCVFYHCEISELGANYKIYSSNYKFIFCDLSCCDFTFVANKEADFFSSGMDVSSLCSAIKSFRDIKFVKCSIVE